MAVLPTQPRRGMSPGGLPGPGMEGQGRGPQLGAPQAESPIPSSIPGVNTVPNEPDPDRIVELFTAYTSGQLSREQLINNLDVLSEGQGGILGLLEGLEQESEQPVGGGSPDQMGMQSPQGAIPPLEGPLDKRHQRISGLLQQYGVMPADADQMSTVLNPNEQGVPYAWEQEQVQLTFGDDPRTSTGIGTGSVTKQGAFDAARSSIAPSIKSLSVDQIWDVINTQAANAPMTNEDINVDFTPRSQVSRSQGGTMPEASRHSYDASGRTSRWDTEEDEVIPPARPQETGVLVWDEDTGQMVDSGTWMPPTGGYTTEAQRIAEAARIDRMQRAQGGSIGDMATGAENRAIQEGGGAYGDASAAADTVRATPAINGGAYGDMGTAATNRAIEAGGGAVGDMSAAADTVTQRNFPGAYGDAAWTAEHTPPVIPETGQNTLNMSAEEWARYKSGQGVNLAQMGPGEVLGEGGSFDKWLQQKYEEAQALSPQDVGNWFKNLDFNSIIGKINPGTAPGRAGAPSPNTETGSGTREDPYGRTGDIYTGDIYYGDDPRRMAGYGSVPTPGVRSTETNEILKDAEEVDKPTEPFFEKDALTGGEGAEPGTTGQSYRGRPAVPLGLTTGFNTVEDFDFPEIKNFLNALSVEARSGMGGENLPGLIVDAMTAITVNRNQGNVQLANSNTNAAIAYLDRAAAVTRDNARRELDEDVALGSIRIEGDQGQSYNTLTLAAKAQEFQQLMDRFQVSGEVPALDRYGNFIYEEIDGKKVVKSKASFEKELSYAELAQQKDLQMTEMFGKLVQTDGAKQVGIDSFETLASQSFGFTKILQQSEQMGFLTDKDGKPMLDAEGNKYDTLEARRYAWTKDIETERNTLLSRQNDNDMEKAELQAATVQYSQELSSLIDAGKLAEAIAVRKEKSLNDRRLSEATKRELTVNTLLALSKPSTMLFAKRYGLFDDIGAALGIDFGQEAMGQIEPPAMITAGQYPTYDELWKASPEERQIMLAETAAYENVSVEGALQRIQDWRPGGTPLRRTAIKGATR